MNILANPFELSPQGAALLAAFDLPAVLCRADGKVLYTNGACRRLLGCDPRGSLLQSLSSDGGELTERFVGLARSSGSIVPGVLHITNSSGDEARIMLRGCRIASDGEPLVLVRLEPAERSQFRLLKEQIERLQEEIRAKLRTEARLRDTLRERELLLRELHHRVKNNMHMLGALVNGAAREADTEDARDALNEIGSRISALGTVQQLLYNSDLSQAVDATAMISAIVKAGVPLSEREVETRIDCESISLPVEVATSVALIVNELVTNAAKHGLAGQDEPRLEVTLAAENGRARFEVWDNGTGFEPQESMQRASGLGLVRGLLRQLDGRLFFDAENGTRAAVEFNLARSGS